MFLFPARIELATFRVLGGRDNHYTTETTVKQILYCLLFCFVLNLYKIKQEDE